MSFKDMPIRRKLMAIILLVSVMVMLLMRGAFFTYEYLRFRQATVRQLSTLGEITAANSTAALAFDNRDDATEILGALKVERHIVTASLYNRAGKLFAKYPANLAAEAFPVAPEPDGYRFDRSHLIGFQPVVEDGRRLGTLHLKFDTATVMQEWLRVTAGIGVAMMAVILIVAFVLSKTLQKQISQPILKLAETAKAISDRRDFSVRAEKIGGGELGLLTDAFNQMLTEIHYLKAALDEHAIVAITDQKGKISYVNDKFCAISKYSREELLGQDHRIVNSGYHPKEFICDLWATIAHGKVWHGEIKNQAKDGSFYWVDTTIVPFLNDQGKPRQYVAVRADITQSKLAQEVLVKQSQELTRSNKDLEQFAYIASHDLQEPLRAVAGCLQILQRRYQNQLDADADELIVLAVDGAHRLQALIEDLLSFSRVGTRGKELRPVDLETAFADALKNLSVAIEESGAAVTHDALPKVMGDQTQLTLLFQNLIGNAIKFRQKEQPVRIHVAAEPNGKLWTFSVRDNGIGIEPHYYERIFEIFQRLHTRQEYPGTGIGLALCRKIVERHGGSIWIESTPQQGSAFYFKLPNADEPQPK